MPGRLIIIAVLAAIAALPAHARSAANGWPDSGAYGPVPVTSTGIVAAAKFAAQAKSVTLKEIVTASQQVAAGVNYALCLKVADATHSYLVTTQMSRDLDKGYTIKTWMPVKKCPKS